MFRLVTFCKISYVKALRQLKFGQLRLKDNPKCPDLNCLNLHFSSNPNFPNLDCPDLCCLRADFRIANMNYESTCIAYLNWLIQINFDLFLNNLIFYSVFFVSIYDQ